MVSNAFRPEKALFVATEDDEDVDVTYKLSGKYADIGSFSVCFTPQSQRDAIVVEYRIQMDEAKEDLGKGKWHLVFPEENTPWAKEKSVVTRKQAQAGSDMTTDYGPLALTLRLQDNSYGWVTQGGKKKVGMNVAGDDPASFTKRTITMKITGQLRTNAEMVEKIQSSISKDAHGARSATMIVMAVKRR